MEITKTAKLKITSHTKSLKPTLEIYSHALAFIINVVETEWDSIEELNAKIRNGLVENLVHATKNNPSSKYDFDTEFPKFPSYFRRACIADAIGKVSSFKSNYANWQQEKEEKLAKSKKFYDKPPKLQYTHNSFPVFYKKEMFVRLSNCQAEIKIYDGVNWAWVDLTFQSKNLDNRGLELFKELNPTLVQNGKKFYLHIPFTIEKELSDKKKQDIVIGVDLGITNSAVCCAMKKDGTVIGRLFVNQPVEKARFYHSLNKIAQTNRKSGATAKPNLWRNTNNLQKQIVQDTVNPIVAFAVKHNASTIVFEHLGKMKVPKGCYGARRRRFKLQFWAKNRIQNQVEQKAHLHGIRISRVLAAGTSKYAFDGTGEVVRNDRKDLCVFASGKQYHADLNASYNIASRFFVRMLLKPLSERMRSSVQAKVPELITRSKCTLSSLISLTLALGGTPKKLEMCCI